MKTISIPVLLKRSILDHKPIAAIVPDLRKKFVLSGDDEEKGHELASLKHLVKTNIETFISDQKISLIQPLGTQHWRALMKDDPDEKISEQWLQLPIEYEEKVSCCRLFLSSSFITWTTHVVFFVALGMAEYFGWVSDVVLGNTKEVAFGAIATDFIQYTTEYFASNLSDNITSASEVAMQCRKKSNTGYELEEDFHIQKSSSTRLGILAMLGTAILGIQIYNMYVLTVSSYNNYMDIYNRGYDQGLVTNQSREGFLEFAKANFYLDVGFMCLVSFNMLFSQILKLEKWLRSLIAWCCTKNTGLNDRELQRYNIQLSDGSVDSTALLPSAPPSPRHFPRR